MAAGSTRKKSTPSFGRTVSVLAETTRMGDGSDEEARSFLKQVTAVQYPLYQP